MHEKYEHFWREMIDEEILIFLKEIFCQWNELKDKSPKQNMKKKNSET